jgi:lipopolysaccharide/colanic/teichoic acid biosynthesis glycosyltransferase
VKRAIDIAAAGLALLVVSPVLILSALAVLIESGRPLIFKQERIGLDGHPFVIYKLRSMKPSNHQEAQSQWTIAADPRVGPVGRFLRRTSFDELPQLWNIVIGDMSLVGPRPERPGFVVEFTEKHEGYGVRHRVPVGLTGLAQVNGLRGDTSIADRARFDNYYIANWSLWLDAKIMLVTVREMLRRGQH